MTSRPRKQAAAGAAEKKDTAKAPAAADAAEAQQPPEHGDEGKIAPADRTSKDEPGKADETAKAGEDNPGGDPAEGEDRPQPEEQATEGGDAAGEGASVTQQAAFSSTFHQDGEPQPATVAQGMARPETGVSVEAFTGSEVPTAAFGDNERNGKAMGIPTDTSGELRHREDAIPTAAHGGTERNGLATEMIEGQTSKEFGGNGDPAAKLQNDGVRAEVGSGTGTPAPKDERPQYPSTTLLTRSGPNAAPMEPEPTSSGPPSPAWVTSRRPPTRRWPPRRCRRCPATRPSSWSTAAGDEVKPSEFFEVPDGPQARSFRRVKHRVSRGLHRAPGQDPVAAAAVHRGPAGPGRARRDADRAARLRPPAHPPGHYPGGRAGSRPSSSRPPRRRDRVTTPAAPAVSPPAPTPEIVARRLGVDRPRRGAAAGRRGRDRGRDRRRRGLPRAADHPHTEGRLPAAGRCPAGPGTFPTCTSGSAASSPPSRSSCPTSRRSRPARSPSPTWWAWTSPTIPTCGPIRRYLTAAALNNYLLLQYAERILGMRGPVDSVSVSTEGQSKNVTYGHLGYLPPASRSAGNSMDYPGQLPKLATLDRWRLAGRRVHQAPTAMDPWMRERMSGMSGGWYGAEDYVDAVTGSRWWQ
jgi:hypothetical protein